VDLSPSNLDKLRQERYRFVSSSRAKAYSSQLKLIHWLSCSDIMPSLLNLPPNLIAQIIQHLAPDKKLSFIQQNRKRPRLASGRLVVCPCFDTEKMMGQLLTIAGKDWGRTGKDVINFGLAHPYIMDCIEKGGNCEVVDALVTKYGVLPSLTACNPDLVR
jgi:hypothetical protein